MRDLRISLSHQIRRPMMERLILGRAMRERGLFVVEILFQKYFILIINYLKMRMMAG